MAMEERDRIDIIATLHDRFNKPAEDIISKMEKMEDQADETGEKIDDLEESIDKESSTTRRSTKDIEQNTKVRNRHTDVVEEHSDVVRLSTRNLRDNTKAIRDSLKPSRDYALAQRRNAQEASHLAEAVEAGIEAFNDGGEAIQRSTRAIADHTKKTARARDEFGRFKKTVEDATETTENNTKATEENTKASEDGTRQRKRDADEWKRWNRELGKITSGFSKRFRPIGAFFQNYFKILGAFRAMLFSDIGALIPQLITALVALGAAFNASLAPAGRLLGTLGQLAPAMAAFIQAQTVLKIAIGGVSDALKVLNDENATYEEIAKAQKEAGANTWEMAKYVQQLTDKFRPLKREVRETFLDGMVPALKDLVNTYFPLLRKELTRTADIMNGELKQGMKELQTPAKQQTIADVMERSSTASGLFVDIMWSLLDVFVELADAAGPAFLETLEAIDYRLDQFANWVRENKNALTDFFNRSNDTAGNFLRGIGFISLGLYGIAKAAKPLEDFLYGGLLDRLEAWSDAMNSPEGQAEMMANYEAMIPNLEAIGNLIGSIIDGAKEIATSEWFAPLVNDLADNGIPMIVEYIKELDKTVGPPLLRISEALQDIDPEVLTSVLAPLGDVLGGLAWALETIVPLFAAMPEPMQKMVMYGIGLSAMGLPGLFMLLLNPITLLSVALKKLTGKGILGWAVEGFKKLKDAFAGIAKSPIGKWLAGVGSKFLKFIGPVAKFLGKKAFAVIPVIGTLIAILWTLWDVFKWLWDNVKPFRDFLTGVWDHITAAWNTSIDWITNTAIPWVLGAFDSIWQKIKEIGGWIADFYNKWIKPVVDGIIWFGKLVFVVVGTLLVLPWQLLWNLVGPIVMKIVDWFKENLPLALNILRMKWEEVSNALTIAWEAVKTIFLIVVGAIVGAALWLWFKLKWVMGTLRALWGFAWDWMSTKVAAVWDWIKNNVINPVINWFTSWVVPKIQWFVNKFVAGFEYFRSKVTSVFNWIKAWVVAPAVNWFMSWVWPKLRTVLNWIGDRFSWLRDRVANVWNEIKEVIAGVYNDKIKPIFSKFGELLVALQDSFRSARDAIGKIWNGLKEKVSGPVRFVVDTVYNDGIRKVWNTLSDTVDLGITLPEVKFGGASGNGGGGRGAGGGTRATAMFDTGGYTGAGSKYTPAGVVHADEFVIRKESQMSLRREAPGLLDALNKYGARAIGAGYDSGGWVKPFQGNFSSNSPYGQRNGRLHAGMDFPTPSGTALTAVSAGSVVGRRSGGPAGNKLSLATDMKGIVAGYHHMSRFAAAIGQNVAKGQVIGYSGNTGRSSGPHLHFSIKKDGKYVNPAPYLAGSGSAGTGGGGGFMYNPFDGLADKFTNQLKSKYQSAGKFVDVGIGATKKMISGAQTFVMDKLNVLSSVTDGAADTFGDVYSGVKTSRWSGVATKALQHTGDFSPGNLASLLRRMNQESGGNPQAINNWDSNAKRGTPSKGLMQVIQPTFNAYRDRSLSSNIYDPMANIVASIRYAKSRYGNLTSAYNRKGGYFKGGLVDHMRFMGGPVETWGNTLVGELGPELFMPSGGGPASLVGLHGPELLSFNREGAIAPHKAVAALGAYNEHISSTDNSTKASENSYYDVKVRVDGTASEIDIERAVLDAIAKAERKKKERR